jgi:hypothetical protein
LFLDKLPADCRVNEKLHWLEKPLGKVKTSNPRLHLTLGHLRSARPVSVQPTKIGLSKKRDALGF